MCIWMVFIHVSAITEWQKTRTRCRYSHIHVHRHTHTLTIFNIISMEFRRFGESSYIEMDVFDWHTYVRECVRAFDEHYFTFYC